VLAKENKAEANEWRGAMDDREATFATKADLHALEETVDRLAEIETRRAETERLRLIAEAEEKVREERADSEAKRQEERRLSSQQWKVGIIVGAGAVIINLLIRLIQGQS
jgi:hypothetical protein